jgi:predicted CXXCH cytochrome family protein
MIKKNWVLALTVIVGASVGAFYWRSTHPASPRVDAAGNKIDHQQLPNYVGGKTCAQCHASEAKAWHGSNHDKAMDHANDSTVLGNFKNDSLMHNGTMVYFLRKADKFIVRAAGAGGVVADFEIKFTFGVNPLQQYLVEFPGGRLQSLPMAWDTQKQQWFTLYPDQKIASDDWLHWSRDGQNWNGMCSDCHSTGLDRNYHAESGSFKTVWKEMDVSCEACHGPGAEHVAQASSGMVSKWISGYGKSNDFGLVMPFTDSTSRAAAHQLSGVSRANAPMAKGHPAVEVAACARCHARRMALRKSYGYHRDFLDEYSPELLRESVYFADGQIQDEDYEYGSFLQSKMFAKGVGCSDCHDPHSLKLKGVENALCTRCHSDAKFSGEAHHHHALGSTGSLCVNCHMPTKTYMQVDARHDHSLRIPRPDLTVTYGTPNACNNCHADKAPTWAANAVAKWYGPSRRPHFSELLAPGRAGQRGSDSSLAALADNSEYPAIVRATAVSLLAGYMHELARTTLVKASQDTEPLVRQASALGLQDMPDSDRLSALVPLLKDRLLAVRIAAANSLAGLSPLIPDSNRASYRRALAESRMAMDANAYFPGGRFNLGQLFEKQGLNDSAVACYTVALELDNRFIPARINLAQLLARMGRTQEAENHFRECLKLNPDFADAYYFLGLLLAGKNNLDSAAVYLALAGGKLPTNPRISYNLALVMQKLNRLPEAIKAMLKAIKVAGEDPEYLYTLAWLYTLNGSWEAAQDGLARLAAVAPNHAGLPSLLREVSSKLGTVSQKKHL